MEHLEGKVSILAALKARRRRFQVILVKYGSRDESYREVLAAAGQLGVPVKVVAEDELTRMSHGSTHGGIIAVCSPLPRMTPTELLQLVDQRGGLAAHRASGVTMAGDGVGGAEAEAQVAIGSGRVARAEGELKAAASFDAAVAGGAEADVALSAMSDAGGDAGGEESGDSPVLLGAGKSDCTIDGTTSSGLQSASTPVRPEPPLLLLIEGVDDARNLGFVLRAADAMGVHAVLIKKHLWDFDPVEVARPSSGAYERLPLVQFEGVDLLWELKRRGLKVYGCIAGGKRTIHDLNLKEAAILAIGGEKRGLSGVVRDVCDRFARIPTVGGPTSLSMSHAGAIVLAEARRQRGQQGAGE